MKKLIILIVCTLFLGIPVVNADEGMWLLPLLQKMNMGTMKAQGLELSADDIYSVNHSSLKDAVVMFGRGCTGEVVSDKGLLITNHHCGFDYFHSFSSKENNMLENGFWAQSMEEELPVPGLTVSFLVKIEDVTDKVKSQLDTITDESALGFKLRRIGRTLAGEVAKEKGMEASLESFYNGTKYYLFIYQTFSDVRLVGVPPESIGKFGGDTENFMWPRHTGDFSLFRIYADKDNNPAEFSQKNIPYVPHNHLKISLKGVKEGDFTMVLGYPGFTTRYLTSPEVDELMESTHSIRNEVRAQRQQIMMNAMRENSDIRLKYSAKYFESSNAWVVSKSMLELYRSCNLQEKFFRRDSIFRQKVNTSSEFGQEYGTALPLIEGAVAGRRKAMYAHHFLNEALMMGTEVYVNGIRSSYFVKMLGEPNQGGAKMVETRERLVKNARAFFRDYDKEVDRKITVAMLTLVKSHLTPEYRPVFFKTIDDKFKGNIEAYVDDMFRRSVFVDSVKYMKMMLKPSETKLQNDPGFVYAQELFNKVLELKNVYIKYSPELKKGKQLFMLGLIAMDSTKALYPDANFTMRLSTGSVEGYSPRDGIYDLPFTRLKGVIQKEDSTDFEFVVPRKLKQLYAAKDYGRYGNKGEMPVCFLTTNDITGGNSGSPVLNAHGELVGVAFDGVYESLATDIFYDKQLNRSICLDIRYLLFVIDKYANDNRLIQEMSFAD
ncbi:MAG TPA: S46 family peptidase [Williamwhitmania sp.]|nr:S46 family peptidase [Williamwhitmania sp.]